MNIIVISGKQGAGKSTFAEALMKALEARQPRVYKFADILYELHNIIRDYMRALGVVRPDKDGPLLQLLGTEWGRNTIDTDIWPNILITRVERDKPQTVFIDDCRFENEFDAMRNRYGNQSIMIRLECPEDIRKKRCPAWRPNTEHPSETGLDKYAAEGRFDIYFETDKQKVPECVDQTLKYIERIWSK